jgi:hypothetical protein
MDAPLTPRSVYFLGQTYTFLATWESTEGAYALIHARVPPGDAPPVHIHHRE